MGKNIASAKHSVLRQPLLIRIQAQVKRNHIVHNIPTEKKETNSFLMRVLLDNSITTYSLYITACSKSIDLLFKIIYI